MKKQTTNKETITDLQRQQLYIKLQQMADKAKKSQKIEDAKSVLDILIDLIQSYKTPQPEPTEEDKHRKELDELYKGFFRRFNYIEDYLHILVNLSRHPTEICMEEIEGMLNEINERLWDMRAQVGRVFQLHGLIHDDEMSAEDIANQLTEVA